MLLELEDFTPAISRDDTLILLGELLPIGCGLSIGFGLRNCLSMNFGCAEAAAACGGCTGEAVV